MQFGPKNAPSACRETVDVEPKAVKWHFALFYFDGAIVFSPSAAERTDNQVCINVFTIRRGQGEVEKV